MINCTECSFVGSNTYAMRAHKRWCGKPRYRTRMYNLNTVCKVCGLDLGEGRKKSGHEIHCGKTLNRRTYTTSINFDYEHANYLKRTKQTLSSVVRKHFDQLLAEEAR